MPGCQIKQNKNKKSAKRSQKYNKARKTMKGGAGFGPRPSMPNWPTSTRQITKRRPPMPLPRPEPTINELIEKQNYDEAIAKLKAEDTNNKFDGLIKNSQKILLYAMIGMKNMPEKHKYEYNNPGPIYTEIPSLPGSPNPSRRESPAPSLPESLVSSGYGSTGSIMSGSTRSNTGYLDIGNENENENEKPIAISRV